MVKEYGRIIDKVFIGELSNGVHTDSGNPRLGRTDSPPLNVSAPATSAKESIMGNEIADMHRAHDDRIRRWLCDLPAKVFIGHLKYRAIAVAITTPPNDGGIAFAASTFSCSVGIPKRTRAIVNKTQP